MVIVDTTVWVDYLNDVSTPEVGWLESESKRQRLGLLDVMLCEVLQGLSTEAAAANYRALRARGRTVWKTIDCLIATFCLEHDHALLHSDRDFDAFEEVLFLQVVHPDN